PSRVETEVSGRAMANWTAYYDTPSYNAWRGNAFETVCLCHIPQLRRALSFAPPPRIPIPRASSI
ncbi:MAG: hypothetical protein Q4A07_10960, partial [Coriobacteriales bacterium]|nr:hypothetical protein [Coriobacteriales bacterium]